MNMLDKFVRWFTEHDEHVLASHIEKDRAALAKALKELEAERDQARMYHDRLENLLESARRLKEIVESPAEGGC